MLFKCFHNALSDGGSLIAAKPLDGCHRLNALADHGRGLYAESGVPEGGAKRLPRGGAVAFVVVGPPFDLPGPRRQQWLDAVQSLTPRRSAIATLVILSAGHRTISARTASARAILRRRGRTSSSMRSASASSIRTAALQPIPASQAASRERQLRTSMHGYKFLRRNTRSITASNNRNGRGVPEYEPTL